MIDVIQCSSGSGLAADGGAEGGGGPLADGVLLNDFWGSDGKAVFSFVTGAIQKSIGAAYFEVTDDTGGARDASTTYSIERGRISKRRLRSGNV